MPTVAIAIFPGVQALDVAGPVDVFSEANGFIAPDARYEVKLLSADAAPLRASNGMTLVADATFEQERGPFDLALVAGGPDLPHHHTPDARLLDWLTNVATRCGRYGSICTGAFALGHAGLLSARNVTTHWQHAAQLATQFPEARVELDRIYLRDGQLVTSAGVTAGIDLSLALVAEDHGPHTALAVAKRLVVFAQRQGGQSQFSPDRARRRHLTRRQSPGARHGANQRELHGEATRGRRRHERAKFRARVRAGNRCDAARIH
jgi:transcriptional regulator GlxA family with amidase domain